MSKKSKKAAQQRRRTLKRSAKEERKTRYAQEVGRTKASRNNKIARSLVRLERHSEGPCNNVGCSEISCQIHQAQNWRARQKARAAHAAMAA